MNDFLHKYVTTEGVFSIAGALWFLVSALFPVIPREMPMGIPLPGFTDANITPGLLIGVSLVPILIKMVKPGSTPFVSNQPPKEGE